MNLDEDITSPTYVGPSFPSCLLCYLCGELFRRPRILPCGHTFCSECLAKIKDEIINSGHSPNTTLSSLPDQQHTPASYSTTATASLKSPLSPERYNNGSQIASNNIHNDRVRFSNGKPSHFHDTDGGSAVDCIGTGVGSYEQSIISSSNTDDVVLRNVSSPKSDKKQLIRSDTYTVGNNNNRRETSSDRTPSRLCCSSAAELNAQPCSNCGHVMTSPRKRSPVKRSSSAKDKNPRTAGCQTQGVTTGPRWDSSPQRKSLSSLSPPSCSFDQKHGKEMELFVCPMPDCNYSMRVMNLSRWSPRNKAVADAVSAWKRMRLESMDKATQSDISHTQSLLVTIPRALINERALQPLNPRRRHSSMVDDIVFDHAISVDGLQRGYLPRGHFTWRSYAAMVGMNILHQLVNL